MAWDSRIDLHDHTYNNRNNIIVEFNEIDEPATIGTIEENLKCAGFYNNVTTLYETEYTPPTEGSFLDLYAICWARIATDGDGLINETAIEGVEDQHSERLSGSFTITATTSGGTTTNTYDVDEHMPLGRMKQTGGSYTTFASININTTYGDQFGAKIETNVPFVLFNTGISLPDIYEIIENYIQTGDWSGIKNAIQNGKALCVNWDGVKKEPKGQEFKIYNTAQRGTWLSGDIVQNVSSPYYRWIRLKMATTAQTDGRIAFYRLGLDNGSIKLIPKIGGKIVFCEYSTDGGTTWNESETFPFEYIYGERINELGTFIYATRVGMDAAPIFDDEETAEGWVNHDPDVDISDALNYENIANKYKITNPTGVKETSTTMGDGSYLRNYFSQEFVCSQNAIYEISNAFFDVGPQGIWEQIKPAIEMMGSNPIDVICGLKWFPFDLSTILSGLSSPQNYIYFGGYKFDLTSSTVMKVVNHGGYLDMGSFTIHDAFPNASDFRNFEPFCKLKIYIPTVGIQDLSYNKYRGKTVSVRLYVDIKSGSTLIALLADGVLYDFFNGSCGVDIPITLTDKAQMGQAQLRNISNLAGVGINMGTAAATKNLGAAVAATANFESTMMDINNTSADQFNVTKGGSSPMGNGCFLPNYIYLIFEYIKTDESPNLNQLEGRITNRSGSLNSFSGYLQIDSINLRTTADMSENEKNEFVNLLQSGIFI